MAGISHYILSAGPDCCLECEKLDGKEFPASQLKEAELEAAGCPKGCFVLVMAVFDDEGKVVSEN